MNVLNWLLVAAGLFMAFIGYLAGLFGEVGSMRADEQCVSMLMPENLENQICLRTPAALACISFEGSEKVVCR